MTRAERKQARRDLAAWCRDNGITPQGSAWELAWEQGSRDVAALIAANLTDGCPAKRLPDGHRLPGGLKDGDYLPDHDGTVKGSPLPDPERGTVWCVITHGDATRDLELPATAPVAVVRTREAPAWVLAAAADYRDARDAWEATRESDRALAPTTVPGISGSGVTMSQLGPDEYARHVPRPRYADYVREHAARNRQPQNA
jgi:transposase InsO family protein